MNFSKLKIFCNQLKGFNVNIKVCEEKNINIPKPFERVSINENLSKGNYDQCFACRTPINDKDKISEMFRKGISCPHCYEMTTTKQKKSFEERTKQISLAKKKRIKHLGS